MKIGKNPFVFLLKNKKWNIQFPKYGKFKLKIIELIRIEINKIYTNSKMFNMPPHI